MNPPETPSFSAPDWVWDRWHREVNQWHAWRDSQPKPKEAAPLPNPPSATCRFFDGLDGSPTQRVVEGSMRQVAERV